MSPWNLCRCLAVVPEGQSRLGHEHARLLDEGLHGDEHVVYHPHDERLAAGGLSTPTPQQRLPPDGLPHQP